jgi:hypothetical protein
MMNCSIKKYINRRHVIGRRYHQMLLQSYHHHHFYYNHHNCRNSSTYTLVEAIQIICSTRYTERKFSSKEVSLDLMKNIIQVAQLAPSSFNLQPYKIVIVSSKEDKELLSSAMLGGNQKTVLDAPLSLVLLADTGAK